MCHSWMDRDDDLPKELPVNPKNVEEVEAEEKRLAALKVELARRGLHKPGDRELTKEQQLAEFLHEACPYNHTDGCSWGYESWTDMGTNRRNYLAKAEKLLRLYQPDIIRGVILVLRER